MRRDFDSLSFILEDLLLNFHTQIWIFLCQLIPHFEQMDVSLLQIKKNLKVRKESLENCVLKKNAA